MRRLEWGDLYLDKKDGLVKQYFCPHAGQLEILNSNARFLAALGGVHSGKTSLGCLWLMNEMQRKGLKKQYLVVAPTFGVVKDSTYSVFENTIRGNRHFAGKFKQSSSGAHYALDTGGMVFFKSGDSNFEGLKPQACLVDEGGNISEDTWRAIRRRVDGTGARVLISTTPYLNFDWIPNEIVKQCDEGNPLYFYKSFPSWANPTVDKAIIENARATLPEHEFKLFYEGIYVRPAGLVYPEFNAACYQPEAVPEAVAYFGAVDWGGSDPTCFILAALTEADELVVFYEHYERQEDIVSTLNAIKTQNQRVKDKTGLPVKAWFCDHRPDSIRALKSSGVSAKRAAKGPESIALGISLVSARLRTGRLRIVRSKCPNGIQEANLYRYPMADGTPQGNKPIDKNNHFMDALRYLVMGIDRKRIGKHLQPR